MTATTTTGPQVTLTLTDEERRHLAGLLEQALKETLVEAHRTDSPNFREHIERRAVVLRSVSDKLRRP